MVLTKVDGREQSPSLLFLFLIAAVVLNLFFVVNPLLIEGIIIGAPPGTWTPLDWWFVKVFFGDFSSFPYDVFIPVLFGFYLLSFFLGFVIPILVLRSTFGRLLKDHEVTFSERRFAVKTIIDLALVVGFTYLALDRLLEYVLKYPWGGVLYMPITSSSYIFFYVLTGFVTGNSVGKAVFPLQVRLECKRHDLRVETSYYKETGAKGRPKSGKLMKWRLVPIDRQY